MKSDVPTLPTSIIFPSTMKYTSTITYSTSVYASTFIHLKEMSDGSHIKGREKIIIGRVKRVVVSFPPVQIFKPWYKHENLELLVSHYRLLQGNQSLQLERFLGSLHHLDTALREALPPHIQWGFEMGLMNDHD